MPKFYSLDHRNLILDENLVFPDRKFMIKRPSKLFIQGSGIISFFISYLIILEKILIVWISITFKCGHLF